MTRPSPHRAALANRDLVTLTASHTLGIVADKTSVIGILVVTYDRAGASAASFVAAVLFLPLLAIAPIVTRALAAERPNRHRWWWHTVQSLMLAGAGVAALVDAELWVVVALTLVGSATTAIMRPSFAVLAPAVVRSPQELVVSNLWTSYASSATSLLAPAIGAALLALRGGEAVLVGAGAVALAGSLPILSMSELRLPVRADGAPRRTGMTAGLATIRRVDGGPGVLAAGVVHQALLTVMGVLAVIVAIERLDLGETGAGVLNLAFGLGGLGASLLAGVVLRRRQLAPVLLGGVGLSSVVYLALGASTAVGLGVIGFGLLGLARTSADVTTRVMLQRLLRPAELGAAFTVLQFASAAGGALSALGLQALSARTDVDTTLQVVAAVLGVVTIGLVGPLRRADAGDELPLVEMALLARVPTLRGVGAAELEQLARVAVPRHVEPRSTIVRAGDTGRAFFVVVDGTCSVLVEDATIRTLVRADGFGEIALLADVARTATVRADTAVELLVVDRADFLAALTGSADAERAVWQDLERLHFADGRPPTV